jgi:hypothetical protein
VIHGDKGAADIYFAELMRLCAHHRFRESVKRTSRRSPAHLARPA